MKRSTPLVLGFVLVAALSNPAWAQRRGNAGVNSIYGQFSAAEMAQAGGDPALASQMREQRQMMQYQQQMFKQEQQMLHQQAKQQEFLKKHPEAARALKAPNATARPATSKAAKKAKAAEVSPPAGASATPAAATAGAAEKTKTKKAN